MILRRRVQPRTATLATACLLLALASCGKKGPPLPPAPVVPARPEEFTIRRLGEDVYLQFTVPTKNADGKSPATLGQMEVRALTGEPVDLAGKSLNAETMGRETKLVATVEVAPPPPPESEKARKKREKENFERAQRREPPLPPPAPPPDPRPKQGEKVTAMERLTPEALTPYVPHLGRPLPPPPPTKKEVDTTPMPVMPKEVVPLRRVYVAAGRTPKGRLGQLSARLGVPLQDVPPAPPQPTAKYTAEAITLEWQIPEGAHQPVQAPVEPDSQAVRLLFPGAVPHTFNVYAFDKATPATALAMPTPLNATPLALPSYGDTKVQFGAERCYVVRTVEARENVTLESDPSPPVCVSPADTFPPAAPKNLAAVGSEGAINLIWEPNTEADLAGYIVLRGEASAGGPLTAITPAPIRETTFRDATVTRGVRYVYAIVAVDAATPQNVSVESNRVEETAR